MNSTIVYIPTTLGDVNLTKSKDGKSTILETSKLTATERSVVQKVLDKYKVEYSTRGEKKLNNNKFTIPKPIGKVHKFTVKALKTDKTTVTAVKLKNGTLEEVREIDDETEGEMVTVEAPRRGCPMTLYEERELKASKVLKTFLNKTQLDDYEQYGAFVAVGDDTRQRYRIAHRHSKVLHESQVSLMDNALVKNLDTGKVICNELTGLPPSEETLAIYVMISVREHQWMNSL